MGAAGVHHLEGPSHAVLRALGAAEEGLGPVGHRFANDAPQKGVRVPAVRPTLCRRCPGKCRPSLGLARPTQGLLAELFGLFQVDAHQRGRRVGVTRSDPVDELAVVAHLTVQFCH